MTILILDLIVVHAVLFNSLQMVCMESACDLVLYDQNFIYIYIYSWGRTLLTSGIMIA